MLRLRALALSFFFRAVFPSCADAYVVPLSSSIPVRGPSGTREGPARVEALLDRQVAARVRAAPRLSAAADEPASARAAKAAKRRTPPFRKPPARASSAMSDAAAAGLAISAALAMAPGAGRRMSAQRRGRGARVSRNHAKDDWEPPVWGPEPVAIEGKASVSEEAAIKKWYSMLDHPSPRTRVVRGKPTSSSKLSEEDAKKAWLAKLDTPTWGPAAKRPVVKRGKVKFYKQDRGWGYIEPENKGELEVFVHYTSIKKAGWRSLMPGEPVEYTIVVKSDGRVACGMVTGPGGADVIGEDLAQPTALSEPLQVEVVCPQLVCEADDVFDDTLYVDDNDFYSN